MIKGDTTVCGTKISELTKGSEKRVNVSCDSCGKEYTVTWNNYGQYRRIRGNSGLTFCQPCAVRQTVKNNEGKKKPSTSLRNRLLSGKKHPSWKGGRYIDKSGYAMVHVAVS